MESKPDKSSSLKAASNKQASRKILADKENKKSSSSSSSSSKKSEESKKTTSNSTTITEEDIDRSASSPSPDPNCTICLEPLQDKSFTNSCCHIFCFTCLFEWSKVKAECPLCKQKFKSILHNVREDHTYDEYNVGSGEDHQRLRYPTTMTPSRALERNPLTDQEYRSQIDSHRMIFAPHSVSMLPSAHIMSGLPCSFRRRIYEQNLWVKTLLGGHFRLTAPEFYKSNPACLHRLIPWLNRELVSFWHDNEAHVKFVLELIMSLLQRYDINSQEFLIHIEPFIGRHTHHFIHELYSFAISPYDMESYDAHADYGLPHSTDDAEHSSPDNDVIPIITGENSSQPRQNQERKNIFNRIINFFEMTVENSNGNSWSNPGPSTSGFRSNSPLIDANISTYTPISDTEQTDEDEIQVLDIVQPQAEQTLEIVDLSSDEEVPETVIVSSDEDNFSQACSPSRVTPSLAAISVDEASSDIECVLECQPSTSRDMSTTKEVSAEKDIKVKEKQELKELYHYSSDTELYSDVSMDDVEHEVKKSPKLASAIVRPWMTERESSHKVPIPQMKRPFSSSCLDDSLSESSNDEREHSPKKLKIQNVVACFSVDHSGSKSSHRSSHKKTKENKKKKIHKPIRRRRYNRIVSDSDSA